MFSVAIYIGVAIVPKKLSFYQSYATVEFRSHMNYHLWYIAAILLTNSYFKYSHTECHENTTSSSLPWHSAAARDFEALVSWMDK